MSKTKSAYFCQSCGYNSAKWLGKCPSCSVWNSFVEEIIQKDQPTQGDYKTSTSKQIATKPKELSQITYSEEHRILTSDNELNRVLGGGIVPGSLVLIGGEPGIGKSTLLLQISLSLGKLKVLYISGEESEQQIKMRAERLSGRDGASPLSGDLGGSCYILAETNTQNIFKQIEILEPNIVIVDSIQTLTSR